MPDLRKPSFKIRGLTLNCRPEPLGSDGLTVVEGFTRRARAHRAVNSPATALAAVAADVAWHGRVIAFLADLRRSRVSRSASLTIRDHHL